MAASSIVTFWAVAVLLIAVPGADWAFVIGTAVGGRSVPLAVGGLALGYTGMTVVVAAGAGAVMARSQPALTALTIGGGLYLIWLGARTFTRPPAPDVPAPDVPASSIPAPAIPAPAESGPASAPRATLVRGIGVSGLNPKGLLLFLALLPQFTSPHGSWPMAGQLALLGLVFTLSCVSFYLLLGSLAGKIMHARPGVARVITRASGAAMVVIGTLLLIERLLT
jgi:threonine/homoserine/homoserine lactone efflux protein